MPYSSSSARLGPFTLAKTKIQKTWVFCCTVYTARKTHNIRGFWHEKRMREKPESHTDVLVSGAHARLLSTFDRTCVVRITSQPRSGDSAEGHVSRDQKPE